MSSFDIVKESRPSRSFKVGKIRADYDYSPDVVREHFVGSIELPDVWTIGLIYGMSGTGKSTISRELFGEPEVFSYSASSVVDDFDAPVDDIARAFSTVGFSSVPSWLKPYPVLSTGEKMRVDLAKCLLSDKPLVVYDEFTSVVDRDVARTLCVAIDKQRDRIGKQLVFVTCHADVLEWLQPDWAFCTDGMKQVFPSARAGQSNTKSPGATNPRGRTLGAITI